MPDSIVARPRGRVAVIALAIVGAAAFAPSSALAAGVTERVSVSSAGEQGNWVSRYPAISDDGRFVAFDSASRTLVDGDTNRASDVFVRDRQTGSTERVSVGSDGAQGNAYSAQPAISADGRFVAFTSAASNLVAGDTNGAQDVFVRDRQSGSTERVSVASDGAQASGVSGWAVAISADGQVVAFWSAASDLVAGDSNGVADVFVHDRESGSTERVSVSSDGTQANASSDYPALSADGRIVAFRSDASNLVAGDADGVGDVFVHDRQSGSTERVSSGYSGAEPDGISEWPSISADGRLIGFESRASNLVARDGNGAGEDLFVRDRQAGETARVVPSSTYGSISRTGRFVVFLSSSAQLVPGDTNGTRDVFVRDRKTGGTERVSVSSDSAEANSYSYGGEGISADGRVVAFFSHASNLVVGDTNGSPDVFVRDRGESDVTATDTSAPSVRAPSFAFASPFPADFELPARNRVAWSATDASGVCGFELEESVDGGAFGAVALHSPTTTSVVREHAFGHRYQYRVRATDCAGNTSAYKTAQLFVPGAEDSESDGPIQYAPDWGEFSDREDFFGTLCTLTEPGATATLNTESLASSGFEKVRRIAWIARRGPDRGTAEVYIDGAKVATVDLSAASLTHRQVVWQKAWTTASFHTIQIRVVTGPVDVDAIAFLAG